MFSQASKPISTSGTTSSALNTDPKPSTMLGVPAKYRWWNVPIIPPERNTTVENRTARVAVTTDRSFRRVSRNAITTVANTSKKPSTHRCTTHQRQYSAVTR
jgi:hypothetical protein